MKKQLLSIIAIALLSLCANAQFLNHFSDGMIDTSKVTNRYFDAQWVLQEGHEGLYTFLENGDESFIALSAQGHGEWDAVNIYFDSPLSLSVFDSVYVKVMIMDTSTTTKARVSAILSDTAGTDAANIWNGDKTYIDIDEPNNWVVIAYPITSFYNSNDNVNADSTAIEHITIGINQGFSSYPVTTYSENAFYGTLLIDYIQVGGEIIRISNISSEVQFADPVVFITKNTTRSDHMIIPKDIDLDGDLDLFSATGLDPDISWYENIDGKGTLGPQQCIDSNFQVTYRIWAADLDNDNDYDFLATAGPLNEVVWYENTDGNGSFGTKQLISDQIDFGSYVSSADIDNDNDMDVISASISDTKIVWYENTDGNGNFGTQQIITNSISMNFAEGADFDGDGDIDILGVSWSYGTVIWYENTDGDGNYTASQTIHTENTGPMRTKIVDLDNDGDLDIVTEMTDVDEVGWFENTDGNGNFSGFIKISGASEYLNIGDLDNDGNPDIVATVTSYLLGVYQGVNWKSNEGGRCEFGAYNYIRAIETDYTKVICVYDFDGDGDNDIISATEDNNLYLSENNPLPYVISIPDTIEKCDGDTISISIEAGYIEGYQWQMETGNGFTNLNIGTIYSDVESESLIIRQPPLGQYSLRCLLYNFNREDTMISDIIILNINPLPIATFTTPSPIVPDENSILTYTGTTSADDSFDWNMLCPDGVPPPTLSGVGPHDLGLTQLGTYTISLIVTDENGCISEQVADTVMVKPSSEFNLPSDLCIGEVLNISKVGTAAATNIWDFDGGNIAADEIIPVHWTTPGEKIISLQVVENGYTSSVSYDTITVNPNAIVNLGDDITACPNSEVSLTASVSGGTQPFSFGWTNYPGGEETVIVQFGETSTYTVTVYDAKGCNGTDEIVINAKAPHNEEICMVLVDSITGKNTIVWEKTYGVNTDFFWVFRMNAFQSYTPIANVPFDDLSIYVDDEFGIDPVVKSYRYKIAVTDLCGNTSTESGFHQTLHLSTSESVSPSGVNLSWTDHYVGFDFTTYAIYRGPSSDNMTLLTYIENSLTSYLDVNPLIGVGVYAIAALKPSGSCAPTSQTRAMTGPFTQSLSNIDEYLIVGENEINNDVSVSVYPNPFSNSTTITTSSNNPMQSVAVMDMTGKTVLVKENINASSVDISRATLATGMYLVKINANKSFFTKIIIE